MAKAFLAIPTWVAVINGVECEVANAIYEHYLKAAGGDPEKLPIQFRKTGEIQVELTAGAYEKVLKDAGGDPSKVAVTFRPGVPTTDSLPYAIAHLGGDPDDRR